MATRGSSGLSGILLVDKPAGMTSHDVVARVRRATGERRVGHAGTLDPDATGLLVVLVGPATRLEPYLSAARKEYEATIRFGTQTDTDDAAGAVIESAPVPDNVFDTVFAEELLATFLGAQDQMPPAYSAIKVGGVTAHRAARAGEALELRPRSIEVYGAVLMEVSAETATWRVAFEVSKGTYIRALARDIGRAAGTVAHLETLRRTSAGTVGVDRALSLDEIAAAGPAGIEDLFVDPLTVLGDLPVVEGDPAAVGNGRPLPLPDAAGIGMLFAVVCGNRLQALYRADAHALVPQVVLATGIRRG